MFSQSRIFVRYLMPFYMLVYGALHRRHHPQPPFDMEGFTRDLGRLPPAKPVRDDLPRRIFIYWRQGFEAAPALVQAVLARWRDLNPEWDVVEVSEDNEAEWVDISDIHSDLPIATRSDALRLRLLARHGGIWADATLLPIRPLDDWLGELIDEGFFAFRQDIRFRGVSSWFIVAVPGNGLLKDWSDLFNGYISRRRHPIAYFSVHFCFHLVTKGNSDTAQSWRRVPKLSADGPHYLKRLLHRVENPHKRPLAKEIEAVPVFKLAWKSNVESLESAIEKLAQCRLSSGEGDAEAEVGRSH